MSYGIGSFMYCLSVLTKLSVMTNCGTLFFTSKTFKKIFVAGHGRAITSWTETEFLIAVLVVEHILMILQMVVGVAVDEKPEFVTRGERDRQKLLENFRLRNRYGTHVSA